MTGLFYTQIMGYPFYKVPPSLAVTEDSSCQRHVCSNWHSQMQSNSLLFWLSRSVILSQTMLSRESTILFYFTRILILKKTTTPREHISNSLLADMEQ